MDGGEVQSALPEEPFTGVVKLAALQPATPTIPTTVNFARVTSQTRMLPCWLHSAGSTLMAQFLRAPRDVVPQYPPCAVTTGRADADRPLIGSRRVAIYSCPPFDSPAAPL